MLRGKTGLQSLAQGVVHWSPPAAALQAAAEAASLPETSQYGADGGDRALCDALTEKLATINGLERQAVMVTAGANQAFANLVFALCDADDTAVIFAPYYFNHMMALQLSNIKPLVGPCSQDTMLPDVGWLREQFKAGAGIRMVVLCNPCNPTGALAPRPLLDEISALCREHGCWLAVDNTYEDFVYAGAPGQEGSGGLAQRGTAEGHCCVAGAHVVNIFSFSKAYGMMGWRVGYLAYDDSDGLGDELLKVQDTVPICPPRLSQRVALAALTSGGPAWVAERVAESVLANREAVVGAVCRAFGRDAILGAPRGAIYVMVRLPPSPPGAAADSTADDAAAVRYLAEHHGVVVIPGGSCGAPGCIRIAFANLVPQACREAAARLEEGLVALAAQAHGKAAAE